MPTVLLPGTGSDRDPAANACDPREMRRQAEAAIRARATAETRAFRRGLADIVIARLGIPAALPGRDAHLHLRRILAGGCRAAFLHETMAELQRRRVPLVGEQLPPEQLAACLGSPMMSVLVQSRLEAGVDAAGSAEN